MGLWTPSLKEMGLWASPPLKKMGLWTLALLSLLRIYQLDDGLNFVVVNTIMHGSVVLSSPGSKYIRVRKAKT